MVQPTRRRQSRNAGESAALCTAATSSIAGAYVLTQSVPVTVIAAVVTLGLAAAHLFSRD
ncbi:hypothetical protein AB0G04_26450 [Actinoplanes sp. NPDC023801]|uniref:hypothetical protein n=1 Tax=Actinoplanes sp. NPDC023801 TaxID=3154595 RepID=UPI0033F80F18